MDGESGDWVGTYLSGGRYRVQSKLGEGGMGFIYRARDQNLDCDVVIKTPRRSLLADPRFGERFRVEVQSLVRLSHPRIVKITEVGDCQGHPFAVLQYLPGGSLDFGRYTWEDDPSTRPAALGHWLAGIAEALDFVHAQGYIHRDVKPSNILFDAHGHAFLADFGMALAVAGCDDAPHAAGQKGRRIVGTPGYLAPEVIWGRPYEPRSDQYCLAITAYEFLSGRRPFDGPDARTLMVEQATRDPEPLSGQVPGLPRALSEVVARATSRDPAARFADCKAFAREALAAVGMSGTRGSLRPSSALLDARREDDPVQKYSPPGEPRIDSLRATPKPEPNVDAPIDSPSSARSDEVPRQPGGKNLPSWRIGVMAGLAVVILASGAFVLHEGLVAAGPKTGRLLIDATSAPPGTTVLLDARPVDVRGPSELLDVAPGLHDVVAVARGYQPLHKVVAIQPRATSGVVIRMKSEPLDSPARADSNGLEQTGAASTSPLDSVDEDHSTLENAHSSASTLTPAPGGEESRTTAPAETVLPGTGTRTGKDVRPSDPAKPAGPRARESATWSRPLNPVI